MSNRYGRNKRRKDREQITLLQDKLSYNERRLEDARYENIRAKQDALNYFMEHTGLINQAVEKISYNLGKAVGEELKPIALELFNNANREIDFKFLDSSETGNARQIRCTIRSLAYNIAFM